MSSKTNLRKAAESSPASRVDRAQAILVYSPAPHATAAYRSAAPITPAMIPEGAPKIRPAQIGAASRTLMMAPLMETPNSEQITEISPNTMPIRILPLTVSLNFTSFLSSFQIRTLEITGMTESGMSFSMLTSMEIVQSFR